MVTVFTPTYNRAYTLPFLYESLCTQTRKDFQWVVVDDGSQDDTENLINNWKNTADFEIVYIKQPNGGKQRAINNGVQYAKGEYFWIVDSDDTVSRDAVEKIEMWFYALPKDEKFAGVSGTVGDKEGNIIGETFKGEYLDATSLERNKYNIKGDKCEVFYTEIMRKFPFPVFEGEKFTPEALVWNRIASAGYKIRWYNDIIYFACYLDDGYTKNVDKNLITNWKGYSLYVKEVVFSSENIKNKILIFGAYCLRGIKKICGMY